jgi:hypothetical protein
MFTITKNFTRAFALAASILGVSACSSTQYGVLGTPTAQEKVLTFLEANSEKCEREVLSKTESLIISVDGDTVDTMSKYLPNATTFGTDGILVAKKYIQINGFLSPAYQKKVISALECVDTIRVPTSLVDIEVASAD